MSRTVSRFPAIGAKTAAYKVFVLNDMHFKGGFDGNPLTVGSTGGNRFYYASPPLLREFVRIANEENPDLILLLGDICDIPSAWELFNEIWSGIDDTIPKAITIGNHDLDVETYDQLLSILRYQGKKENAGSKFNQTYSVNENLRFIMIDSTFDANNQHGDHYADVHFHTDSLPWLADVLANAEEENVLIGTHVAPHQDGYFNPAQKLQLKNIVDTACANNPKLKVTWLFGHHHELEITPYNNLGSKNKGYLMPTLVLDENGRFTEITISEKGLDLKKRDLIYTA